jgi:serine/threonine-protein kinase
LSETKPSPDSPTPRAPRSFGRYEVVEEIGDGAMGRVYRGFDPLVRRSVAIKTVRSEHLTTASADEYLRRFRREAQAAGGLSHPHIVAIYDVGEDYFVMEFLEGTSLEALLKQRVKLEVAEALRLLAPVADALDYAHKAGIVHRDIKPANIMVLPDGRPKLMDFGVAHLEASVMTRAGEIIGSPSYMAPEQIAGLEEVSAGSDLFSLAVVAYEAITGRKPFEGTSLTNIIYRVVHEEPPPPRKWNIDLPAHYDDVFRRALSKRPADRYPSAAAFLDALNLREFELGLSGVFSPADAAPAPPAPPAIPAPRESAAGAALGRETIDVIPPASAPGAAAAPAGSGTRAPRSRWMAPSFALAAVLALGAAWALLRPAAPGPVEAPMGGLRVETQPAGASVWLDGVEVGQAPLTLAKVPPGSHTVRVALPGFAPAQLGFEVVEDARTAPLKFALDAVSGTLRVRSEPNGASVRLDGKPSGTTPLEGLLVSPGLHEVRLEREGFGAWVRRVEARAGQTVELEARLTPRLASPPTAPAAPAAFAAPEPIPEPTPEVVPVREGDLVELTADVTPPRRIAGETAAYPKAALKLKLEGVVALEMIVTEEGLPSGLRIVESAGQVLDEAALEAARSWRFEPARQQGVKVRVRWQVRQRFEIK